MYTQERQLPQTVQGRSGVLEFFAKEVILAFALKEEGGEVRMGGVWG